MSRIRKMPSPPTDPVTSSLAPRERIPVISRTRRSTPNQLRRRILWAFGAASTITIIALLVFSPWFYVRSISLIGLGQLTQDEIRTATILSVVPEKTSIVLAPTHKLEQQLRRLPFVANAFVTRRLPATLIITIVPRKPIATLETGSTLWELDRDGIPIRRARPELVLPTISAASNEAVTAGMQVMDDGIAGGIKAFKLCGNSRVIGFSKIDVDPNADLCLNMNDGVVIRLGQPEELQVKLALAERIYEERPDIAAEVEAIDLRYPDAPACTPRKGRVSTDNSGSKSRRPTSKKTGTESMQLLRPDVGRISSRTE